MAGIPSLPNERPANETPSSPAHSLNRSSTLKQPRSFTGPRASAVLLGSAFCTHTPLSFPGCPPGGLQPRGRPLASPGPWTRASLRGPQEGAGPSDPAPESPPGIPLARGKPRFFCSSQKAPGNCGAQRPLEHRLEEPCETETHP